MAAVMLSMSVISAGAVNLHLLLEPIFQTVAAAAALLAAAAVVMEFWDISPHSRRLGQPRFWGTLLTDLLLLGIIAWLYVRAYHLPRREVPIQPPDFLEQDS